MDESDTTIAPNTIETGGKAYKIPWWRMVIDQAGITPEVANYEYQGAGTAGNPYVVKWIPEDPRNPMNYNALYKWSVTMTLAVATLAVALVSSAYTGGVAEIMRQFDISQEVAILGVSLFVVGFAIGPLLWAPLSELFGRQILFIVSYGALTAFNAGCAGAQNAQTLLVLRFFAGAFGSSPLTNAGGAIADMFPASQRGQAMAIFAAAPFLGPVLGPIIGGFLGESAGWRWVMGFLAAFSGFLWIVGTCFVPETYAPVLLRQRATKLSKMTGKRYVSIIERHQGKVSLSEALKTSLSRPWILLFREPIVLLLSIYMAIIYGTLYMLFAAFPIVYQQERGWSTGIGGLAFLSILAGMMFAIAYTIPDNKRYIRVQEANGGLAPPESRLPPTMIGCICLPVGLFWFAWTNSPSIHWMASIAAGVPFGFGQVLVFLSIMNYLIDAYTIFAASVLAANSVLRSLFGAAFPLFTTYMYNNLGIHWASSIPGFLAVACIPFPFLFYRFGLTIRRKCKYAAKSAAFMEQLLERQDDEAVVEAGEREKQEEEDRTERDEERRSGDGSWIEADEPPMISPRRTQTWAQSPRSRRASLARSRSLARSQTLTRYRTYEGNPYDIDRANSRYSFG